jgi:hypothetical protein
MSNYIDNEEFLKLILIYRKTGNLIVYNEIGRKFLAIVTNKLRMPCFINYSDDRKSEMISDALWYMTKNLSKYDPTFIMDDSLRKSPFAYFGKVVDRAFFQKIAEYKKRDKMFKPISYIDNIESDVFQKSTVFREVNTEKFERVTLFDPRHNKPQKKRI